MCLISHYHIFLCLIIALNKVFYYIENFWAWNFVKLFYININYVLDNFQLKLSFNVTRKYVFSKLLKKHFMYKIFKFFVLFFIYNQFHLWSFLQRNTDKIFKMSSITLEDKYKRRYILSLIRLFLIWKEF